MTITIRPLVAYVTKAARVKRVASNEDKYACICLFISQTKQTKDYKRNNKGPKTYNAKTVTQAQKAAIKAKKKKGNSATPCEGKTLKELGRLARCSQFAR